jgi:hypothetical protein
MRCAWRRQNRLPARLRRSNHHRAARSYQNVSIRRRTLRPRTDRKTTHAPERGVSAWRVSARPVHPGVGRPANKQHRRALCNVDRRSAERLRALRVQPLSHFRVTYPAQRLRNDVRVQYDHVNFATRIGRLDRRVSISIPPNAAPSAANSSPMRTLPSGRAAALRISRISASVLRP